MILIVLSFLCQRGIKKTTVKLFCNICSAFTITMIIVLNICPLIICVVALHKQVDEAVDLCSKSHVIVIIITYMHD